MHKTFETTVDTYHHMTKMVIDQFKVKYRSPYSESSLWKGIPIEFLPTFKQLFGTGYLIKYRGTSKDYYSRPQAHCHKQYADTFAVYRK